MIPKIIHYCWFGKGEKSALINKCIKTWKKYCPDYQIIEWNETNFDVEVHQYCKSAFQKRSWAFVSDYARLKIIYDKGGIYLDTDVELTKNLDFLLENKFFCGFELQHAVNTGIGFGAEKDSIIVKKMLEEYNDVSFITPLGKLNKTPCTYYNSAALSKLGVKLNNTYQKASAYTIYPTDFFSPKSYETGIINITHNTTSIHHFESSWEDIKSHKKKMKQHRICAFWGQKIGTKIIFVMEIFSIIKKKGIASSIEGLFRRLKNLVNV